MTCEQEKYARGGALASFKLCVVKPAVEAVFREQLFVVALFNDVAVAHNENFIRVPDGGETVCDYKAGASLHHFVEGLLDTDFGERIDGGGRFIEDQDGRKVQHDSGDAEELLLSGGEVRGFRRFLRFLCRSPWAYGE